MWFHLAVALASEPLLGPVEEVRGGVQDANGTFVSHAELARRYPDAPFNGTANALAAVAGVLGVGVALGGLQVRSDDKAAGNAVLATGGLMYVGGMAGALKFRFGRKDFLVRMAQQEGEDQLRLAATPVPAPVVPAPLPPVVASSEAAPPPARGPACGLYHMAPGTERGLAEEDAAAVDLVCRLTIQLTGIENMGPKDDDGRFMALVGASARLPGLPARCTEAMGAVATAPASMAVQMLALPEACGPELGGARTQDAVKGWAAGRWQPWIERARPHLLASEAEALDAVWPLP